MSGTIVKSAFKQLLKVADAKDALVGKVRDRANTMIEEVELELDEEEQIPAPETSEKPKSKAPQGKKNISVKPMLKEAALDLYYELSDELEASTPHLSLHAKVSLGSFLQCGQKNDDLRDVMTGMVLDLVIIDDNSLPVAAFLLTEEERSEEEAEIIADLLEMAELPVLELSAATDFAEIWGALEQFLAYEIAA